MLKQGYQVECAVLSPVSHLFLGPVRTSIDYFFGLFDRLDYQVPKIIILILIIIIE